MDRLKITWVRFDLWWRNFLISILEYVLYPRQANPAKILVFRTGSIGDNICALPSIVAMRSHYSSANIHILTTAGVKSPVSMQRLLSPEYYDSLIDYEKYSPRELLSLLRKEKYDLVIELSQNMVTLFPLLRNMIFFKMAGIRSGWGWRVTTSFYFRQTQERLFSFETETRRLLSLLKRHGVAVPFRNTYPLNIQRNDLVYIDSILSTRLPGVQKNKLIALVPGAKRPQNRYPLDRFVRLAKWLTEKEYKIIVIGGPEDKLRGEELAVIDGVISLAGELTPIQSSAIMSRCFLTISNDTGPMHLSYAAGTPVLAIFSSRDFPVKWFPPGGNTVLRNNNVHCSICFSETCANNICMQGISLNTIKETFSRMESEINEE